MEEADLRRSAFGDQPGANVWQATRSPDPRTRWLAAVTLGAQGHYAAAATLLDDLRHTPDATIASLALSTRASHCRQLGNHAGARHRDAAALGRVRTGTSTDPDGVDPAGARTDALLGLAADAIGKGDLVEARRLHARADPATWRTRVRHGWVAAEIELAAGRPDHAVQPAEAAKREADGRDSIRHQVKSDLVLGTALVVWGTPEGLTRGVELVECDLNHSVTHGLFSLIWPSALVLVGHDPTVASDVIDRAMQALSCVLRRADPISRRVAFESPWVPTWLLRSGEPPNADPQTNFLTD